MKKYKSPKFRVSHLSKEDVITTSYIGGGFALPPIVTAYPKPVEDHTEEIFKIMSEWKCHAKLDDSDVFVYFKEDDLIYVITNKPGYLIGQRGYLIKGYGRLLEEQCNIANVIVAEQSELKEV